MLKGHKNAHCNGPDSKQLIKNGNYVWVSKTVQLMQLSKGDSFLIILYAVILH